MSKKALKRFMTATRAANLAEQREARRQSRSPAVDLRSALADTDAPTEEQLVNFVAAVLYGRVSVAHVRILLALDPVSRARWLEAHRMFNEAVRRLT